MAATHFTQSHYERIADSLAESRSIMLMASISLVQQALSTATLDIVADELADLFEQDNPRFKRDLFLRRAKGEAG